MGKSAARLTLPPEICLGWVQGPKPKGKEITPKPKLLSSFKKKKIVSLHDTPTEDGARRFVTAPPPSNFRPGSK